ncbi:hypothetical protein CSO01_16960 [Cellulomonas soli]|uniref:Uncharacterized protein n=1 Tax=Cellulomonas soli TaxID=931535 RepID=A0A512PCQ6_9CELL|nr:hypothetical protein CSO01_16960 [Cellulomonas soli]
MVAQHLRDLRPARADGQLLGEDDRGELDRGAQRGGPLESGRGPGVVGLPAPAALRLTATLAAVPRLALRVPVSLPLQPLRLRELGTRATSAATTTPGSTTTGPLRVGGGRG